jgi:hypothetical protein
LALACPGKPHRALAAYRQRWTIETMFANLKTKGFNLEDTHITDPGKLSTLLAVLALTVTLTVKTGVATLQKIAASAPHPDQQARPQGLVALRPRRRHPAKNRRVREACSSNRLPPPDPIADTSR